MKNILTHSTRLALGGILFAGAVGCSSPTPAAPPRMYVHPRVPPPPNQQPVVWTPPTVVPYAVGRYVDPHDPDVIHEAHTLYRREKPSRPNLEPPASLVFPSGGTPSDSPANVVQFYRDALQAELNSQRATSEQIIQQSRQLQQGMQALQDQAQSLRQALEQTGAVRHPQPTLTNQNNQVQPENAPWRREPSGFAPSIR